MCNKRKLLCYRLQQAGRRLLHQLRTKQSNLISGVELYRSLKRFVEAYHISLKTGSLDNAIQEVLLANSHYGV